MRSISRGRRGYSRRERQEITAFHLFTLPWLLGFLLLSVMPLVLGLATSFTNYDGLNLATIKFVGIRNYTRAFSSQDFYISLSNTAKYAIVSVPVGLVLSMLLAVVLNQPIRGRDLFRMLYYIPAILPTYGAIQAWRLLFGLQSGLVNAFLSLFSPGTAINWINDHYMATLYLYSWWGVGGPMVLFLAGLQGIPVELYEAARLDGAGRFGLFRHVTLPLITPVIFFQLILGFIGALQILEVPILLTGRGGQSGQVQMAQVKFMYMVYTYSQVFDFQRFGYGVALAWICFVIVLVLTLIIIRSSRYWVYYEVAQEGERR
jgi:multiple sugar transport system permease protein